MSPSNPENPNMLFLPPLEFGPIKHSIGIISHVLDLGGNKVISRTEEFFTSPRVRETLYVLDDGQKILITKKKKLELPRDVDGVLFGQLGNALKWIAHRKLNALKYDVDEGGLEKVSKDITESWYGKFNFQSEEKDLVGTVTKKGLRPPQIGSLHSIGAHWSLYQQPATIVMPTGTGKTEAMLATLVAYSTGSLLVVVPSKVLRDQTAKKFLTLGLLRSLGNLSSEAKNPIVGVIKKRLQSEEDLDIFNKCNVVIATMSVMESDSSGDTPLPIADYVKTLIVDEAHHVGAVGWGAFREKFKDNRVLQFTATPYRRDGKLVDGKVIYEYPLHSAQNDGYFKNINFEPVYEIDQENADEAIATKGVEILRRDLASGKDHLMMARCASIGRARTIYAIYDRIAPDLNPVLIHSEEDETDASIEKIRSRQSRIVICVNMLGEGFDLPQLKIAAVHDTHKSLAILLQFTGRFTRTAGEAIGDATVVANIADQDVSSALERLYSEDADWNQLLSEFSSDAAKTHSELIAFLNASEVLDNSEDEEKIEISHHLLRPTFSTLMYEANSFTPKKFFEGIPRGINVHRVWIHEESNTLYFVTRLESPIRWTRSRKLRDRIWDLHVFHFDEARNLLFVSSSDKSSNHEKIAGAIGATKLVSGDIIFRALGRINRLIFQNVGVTKHGRRNLRYAMYTGSDVATALSVSERAGSVKSNLSGTGWENGEPVTIGCSYKGRVWARDPGSIPELIKWCESVGGKIKDGNIDTADIIANVLIPEEVTALPDKQVLSIEWPLEIIRQSEERVILKKGGIEKSVSLFDLQFIKTDIVTSQVYFRLVTDPEDVWLNLSLTVGGDEGFKVTKNSQEQVTIRVGNLVLPIEEYFSNYPPMIRFVDISELDGNLLIKPQNTQELIFPEERFEAWDWVGVDLRKESIWKNGAQREDSIQWRAAQQFIAGNFETVFDDDGAGEAADLVCFKEEDDHIRLALIHCKFTTETTAGERISDVVEVSSQAVRSAKWKWKFKDLCKHILDREKRLTNEERVTRFLLGSSADMNKFVKISRFKEIRAEIIIVQPGLSKTNHTPDQTAILAAAHSYLKETVGVDLDVICSE
ncbi:MAG: DEAD/DEAH box helicase family protein [Candidatus Parcubacteria bacterium]|nr:DEAD/DEAH box helicase family protein [Candidatus Parcubacteria bacterium]